jgi:hypothetical protein
MLRQLDAEPLATDFHVFLADSAREATAVKYVEYELSTE